MKRVGIAIVASLLAFAYDADADPPDRQQCARAYEAAQRLRRAHQLRGARDQLLVCSRAECPGWVRRDCTPWLGEVDVELPTIVLTVHDDAGPRTDVRVKVDGEVVAERISAEPIAIDPGAHTIVLEAPGTKRVERSLTLQEREKDRRVDVALTRTTEPEPPVVRHGPEPPPQKDAPVPTLTWVLGGVGVAALGFGVYFQASGMSQRSDLDACAPSCSQRQVDDARRSLWAGNVLIGVSVVAIAAAVYLYVSRPTVTDTALLTGAWR